MLQTIRTNSKNSEYPKLILLLDKEILKRDGKIFKFYNNFNSSENFKEVAHVSDE